MISTGSVNYCGINQDGLFCVGGEDNAVRTQYPDNPKYFDINHHEENHFACALDQDNNISCWGDDTTGVISEQPEGEFEFLSVGMQNACAIDSLGYATCWGDNSCNQESEYIGKMTHIDVSDCSVCGVTDQGALSCWGDDTLI